MDQLVKEKGFAGWAATSAKDNDGIEEMINEMVQQILDNRDGIQHVSDSDILHIKEEDEAKSEKKENRSCCLMQ